MPGIFLENRSYTPQCAACHTAPARGARRGGGQWHKRQHISYRVLLREKDFVVGEGLTCLIMKQIHEVIHGHARAFFA